MNKMRWHTSLSHFSRPLSLAENAVNRINREQASKIACVVNSDFGEVTWYYPSNVASNTENDSYVTYDHHQNFWVIGAIERTDGIDKALEQANWNVVTGSR